MSFKLKNDPAILSRPGAKRDYNRLLFAEVAPKYHRITRLMSFFMDAVWKRSLISGLPVILDGPVLDIATGTGDLLALSARRWPLAALVGCDLSPAMLSLARGRVPSGKIALSCQDMSTLAVRSGSMAIITGGYALRNAPDLRATLAECFRVLKPGGAAAFLDFSRSPNNALFYVQYRLLRLWGGLWGFLMHGNPAVYAYIAESLRLFPDRNTLKGIFANVGFVNISMRARMFGFIDIIIARKPT